MKTKLVCLIILAFHLNAFAQAVPKGTQLKPVYENGRWGYADAGGTVVIAARFDAALPFADGLARVGVVDEELPEIGASPNIRWGYIDERGRVLVELRYAVLRDFAEGLAAAAVLDAEKPERPLAGRGERRNLKWGYVERGGREVIPMQFLDAGDFAEGLAAVNPGGGGRGGEGSLCGTPANYGYIDRTGAFVIKPQFTHASKFQNGRARVSVGRITYAGRCLCCGPRFIGSHGFVDRGGTFTADEPKGGGVAPEEGRENYLRRDEEVAMEIPFWQQRAARQRSLYTIRRLQLAPFTEGLASGKEGREEFHACAAMPETASARRIGVYAFGETRRYRGKTLL